MLSLFCLLKKELYALMKKVKAIEVPKTANTPWPKSKQKAFVQNIAVLFALFMVRPDSDFPSQYSDIYNGKLSQIEIDTMKKKINAMKLPYSTDEILARAHRRHLIHASVPSIACFDWCSNFADSIMIAFLIGTCNHLKGFLHRICEQNYIDYFYVV